VSAPTAEAVAWKELAHEIARAQYGLLRLRCPQMGVTQLQSLAVTAAQIAMDPLASLPLEHLECGMQPRFRDARLRLPSATDGKRYDGPEGKRQGRMPVGGIGLGGP